jgi:hypothetical protein
MVTHSQFDRCRSYLGGRNPLELIQVTIVVPAATVSTKSHDMHSNVRMSKPGGPDTMPVNIICPSHFVQGGRSIAVRLGSSEMLACVMLPLALSGNATLSATDVMIRRVVGSHESLND